MAASPAVSPSVVRLLQIQGWLNGLLQMVLLGSAFAHLMLLRPRHRLQAFNLLLLPGGWWRPC